MPTNRPKPQPEPRRRGRQPTSPPPEREDDAVELATNGQLTLAEAADHPLFEPFMLAIAQAVYGKGERHGGGRTPFLDQPWHHYAQLHGRGFLTGQAAKKLEEAASRLAGPAFEHEALGALVYLGAAVLYNQESES